MALSKYKKAILTASDIPQLTRRHIKQMFADLEEFASEILIDIDTVDDLRIFYHWQNLLGNDSDMFCPITMDTIKKTLSL